MSCATGSNNQGSESHLGAGDPSCKCCATRPARASSQTQSSFFVVVCTPNNSVSDIGSRTAAVHISPTTLSLNSSICLPHNLASAEAMTVVTRSHSHPRSHFSQQKVTHQRQRLLQLLPLVVITDSLHPRPPCGCASSAACRLPTNKAQPVDSNCYSVMFGPQFWTSQAAVGAPAAVLKRLVLALGYRLYTYFCART